VWPPQQLLHEFLDRVDGLPADAPEWFRAAMQYVWLTTVWWLVRFFSFAMLGVLDRSIRRSTRALARGLSVTGAERSATAYLRIASVLTVLRLATGVAFRWGSDNFRGSVLTEFTSLRRRVISECLAAVAVVIAVATWIVRRVLSRSIPNALIWLAVAWHNGWLNGVISAWSRVTWDGVQPSQVAAVIGLVVVAWAVIVRSDIRGRVEFNKTASLEGRKRLALMRKHLNTVILSEVRIRDNAEDTLMPFPSETQLTDLTGCHGLRWSKNRLAAAETCALHGPNSWLAPIRSRQPRPSSTRARRPATLTADDEATTTATDALRECVRELRDLGYWYKVTEILPPAAQSALFEIEWMKAGEHAIGARAAEEVDDLLDLSTARDVQWAWESATTSEEMSKAINLAEAEVRRRVGQVRDFLWEGYVISGRLLQLDHAIGRIRLEGLVDRLKQ
jgi:hypothetical protein